MTKDFKVPFKWKLRWFLQGMGSVLGLKVSKEQIEKEVRQCSKEVLEKNK